MQGILALRVQSHGMHLLVNQSLRIKVTLDFVAWDSGNRDSVTWDSATLGLVVSDSVTWD